MPFHKKKQPIHKHQSCCSFLSWAKERKKEHLHLLLKSIDFLFKWHWIEGLWVSATQLCMPSIIHHFHQQEHLSFYLFTGPYVEHRPHLAPLSDLLNLQLCWQQTLWGCSASACGFKLLSAPPQQLNFFFWTVVWHRINHFNWCMEKYVTVDVMHMPSYIVALERLVWPVVFDTKFIKSVILCIRQLHSYDEILLQSHYDQRSWVMIDCTKWINYKPYKWFLVLYWM